MSIARRVPCVLNIAIFTVLAVLTLFTISFYASQFLTLLNFSQILHMIIQFLWSTQSTLTIIRLVFAAFFFFFNVGEIFKKTLEGWLSASSYPGAPVPHLRTETPVCSFWAICPSVLPSYLVPSPKTTPSDVFSLEITIESPGPQPQSHVPLSCNSWRLQRFAFLGGGGG